jgi:hypothetical protein
MTSVKETGRRIWWTAGLTIHIALACGFSLALLGLFVPTVFWAFPSLFVPVALASVVVAMASTVIVTIHVAMSHSLTREEKWFWFERLFLLGPFTAAKYLQQGGRR